MLARWIGVILTCAFIGGGIGWFVHNFFGVSSFSTGNGALGDAGLAGAIAGNLPFRALASAAIQNGLFAGMIAGCVVVICDAIVKSQEKR